MDVFQKSKHKLKFVSSGEQNMHEIFHEKCENTTKYEGNFFSLDFSFQTFPSSIFLKLERIIRYNFNFFPICVYALFIQNILSISFADIKVLLIMTRSLFNFNCISFSEAIPNELFNFSRTNENRK